MLVRARYLCVHEHFVLVSIQLSLLGMHKYTYIENTSTAYKQESFSPLRVASSSKKRYHFYAFLFVHLRSLLFFLAKS